MIGLLVTGLVDILLKAAFGRKEAAYERPAPPNASRVGATDRSYRRWATRHGLQLDGAARGWRGTFGRHTILLRPGLDGSAPVGVEVEIAIDHTETTTFLLTRQQERQEPVAKALAALFDERALDELRSIAVVPGTVRLRFAPLAKPNTFEVGIVRVVEVLEELVMARAVPYR